MSKYDNLEKAVAALEAQRPVLGDAVVDAALAPMREKLAALKAQEAPIEQQRKLATILFADISGFTAMSETLDAEEVANVMNALWQRLDTAINRHGGTIDKHVGDAVMALWGIPATREDDPERAIRAALAMQAELADIRSTSSIGYYPSHGASRTPVEPTGMEKESPAFHMRIGINTGPVLLGAMGTKGEYTAMGDAVNLASRLEHAAPVDGILISQDTYRHVRGIFDVQSPPPLAVKGKSEPVLVYVVMQAKPRSFHVPSRGIEGLEIPMVGRDAELKHLQDHLEMAIQDRELHLVTIFGDAGVGKSRLLYEFENWLELQSTRFWYFKGRADQGMTGRPFSLLRDVLAFRFQIQDSDPPDVAREKLEKGVVAFFLLPPEMRGMGVEAAGSSHASHFDAAERAHFIGQLLGLDFTGSPHLQGVLNDAAQIRSRAFFYLAQLFQTITHTQPAVILLEDIHWADDGSLDWLNYLSREVHAMPLLVIGLARPTLLERRPLWGEGHDCHTCITLPPLNKRESRRLVEEILRNVDHIPTELRDLIVNGAEGNPYYVEELVKMLIEAHAIITGKDRWRVEVDRLNATRVPPTLTEVLQARLDTLSQAERETLKCASVVGQVFWDAVVAKLAQTVGPEMRAPKVSTQASEPEIQNAGNGTELALARLRQREMVFAREVSQFAGTREYTFKHAILRDVTYETVLLRQRRGYHALAVDWLIERSGARADEFAGLIAEHYDLAGEVAQALEWYKRAAKQAQAVFANDTAITFYRRILALLQNGGAARVEILLSLGDVFMLVGQWTQAEECYHEALATAEKVNDRLAQAQCQRLIGILLEKRGEYGKALTFLEEARAGFTSRCDRAGACRTLAMIGRVYHQQGNYVQARESLEASLALGREVDDKRGIADALNNLGNLAYRQEDHPAAQAHHTECLALRRAIGDKRGIANSLNGLGNVAYLQKDWTTAHMYWEESLALRREMGDKGGIASSLNNLGGLAYLEKDYDTARKMYEESLALKREMGDKPGIALSLSNLGTMACLQGNLTTSLAFYRESIALHKGTGDRRGIALSLSGLAGVAGRLGQAERAARLAGATQSLIQKIGVKLDSDELSVYDPGISAARSQLGEAAFVAAWAIGQAMTLEETVAYALKDPKEG
ncbi:MAG: tetratricopeptide repeat protein [Chloroflexi bacterium]|nr:tetratricopeptide repeat protein [Chloroflexota bacterium]